MSVVLVAFVGSPVVSEEAQQKDKELNLLIEKKVQEILEKNDELTLSGVVQAMMYEDIENLPPGGGLDSKRSIIDETYKRINPNKNSDTNIIENNSDDDHNFSAN